MIDIAEVQRRTFVRTVHWFREIESTNSYALQNMPAMEELPCLIGANLQLAGRGRGQNRWWAGEGALTFSLVFAPDTFDIPTSQWPQLSLYVGLAACRALESMYPPERFWLKWPNDVYFRNKKLCGILIEGHASLLVCGIGINVNNSLAEAPAEVAARGTALCDEFGSLQSPTEVLIRLLAELDEMLRFFPTSSSELLLDCRVHCFLTGCNVIVDDGFKQLSGKCLGIGDEGALRVLTDAGERQCLGGIVTEFR